MLVLSRKKGETIMIGNDIEIMVLEVLPEGVKLGINAPKEVGILRKELFVTIAETNKDAISSSLSITEIQNRFKDYKKE